MCNCNHSCNCRSHDRGYGFSNFIGDVFLTCLTFGFWLIWVFIREIRR